MNSALLTLSGITRSFNQGPALLDVLKGVDLAIQPGELVALVGPSGAGKSTLLQIIGLLEAPTAGAIQIGDVDATSASEKDRTILRRSSIGFVYQFHHLLPEFSALENVAIPQRIAGVSKADAIDRARYLLYQVGLAAREDHRPGTLSGGEQQRVAIARALANDPSLLLADEPTGNLDTATANSVFETLTSMVRSNKLAGLIATHNPELAQRMDRIVTLRDGKLVAA
jgi:lipoprotein-releasing system ATP-binding protein